jgi:hypothetical protein
MCQGCFERGAVYRRKAPKAKLQGIVSTLYFFWGVGVFKPKLKKRLKMSAEKNLFKGVWAVIAQEYRRGGEWRRECDFTPDDWLVGFLADGRYFEIFRPSRETRAGRWVCDRRGLIAIGVDSAPEFLTRCVFEGDESGGWLCFYEYSPAITLDRDIILAHHAHERWGLRPQ